MRREDFMRLENQPYSWSALTLNAKNKEQAINTLLVLKNKVQSSVQMTSKQVEVQMIEESKIREKKAQENEEPSKMADKKTIEIDVGAMRMRDEGNRRSLDSAIKSQMSAHREFATPNRPSSVQQSLTRPISVVQSNSNFAGG
jgi:hypothetical protein